MRVADDNNIVIYGKSTEAKPTGNVNSNNDVKEGDWFYETDTGNTYVFDGTQWKEA